MSNAQGGDTIVLADGSYALTSTLYLNGRHNVTIRGHDGCDRVLLVGKGMDNPSYGDVPFGIWSNSINTTVAHLTIRDTYDNLLIFNAGARSPRVYSVKLPNAGSQFIKANPTDAANSIGVDNGIVEYGHSRGLARQHEDHRGFRQPARPPGISGSRLALFGGINWASLWCWRSAASGVDGTNHAGFCGAGITSRTFAFSPGRKTLTKITFVSAVPGTATIADDNGQQITATWVPAQNVVVPTRRTKPSAWVRVSSGAGRNMAITT